jgi:thiol-disulfide isomerase/thioredoxin
VVLFKTPDKNMHQIKSLILTIIVIISISKANTQTVSTIKQVTIKGTIWANDDDTITLTYVPYKLGITHFGNQVQHYKTSNGSFEFIIPVTDQFYYCSLISKKSGTLLFNNQLIESGDSISIKANIRPHNYPNNNNQPFLTITGRNAAKNQVQHNWAFAQRYNKIRGVTQIYVNRYQNLASALATITNNLAAYTTYWDSLCNNVALDKLDDTYSFLKADIELLEITNLLSIYSNLFELAVKQSAEKDIIDLLSDYKHIIEPRVERFMKNYNYKSSSPLFLDMAVRKTMMDARNNKKSMSMIPALEYLNYLQQWPVLNREIILTTLIAYFINYNPNVGDLTELLIESMPLIHKPALSATIDAFKKSYSSGATIYPFVLTDPAGNKVDIRTYKDKVVIIDFWFTGCRACITMSRILKMVKDKIADDNEFVFISISVDKDKATWLNSVAKGIYTHEDFINLYTNGEGEEHELIKYYNFSAYPRLLLIGKNNRLANSNPPLPSSINELDMLTDIILKLKN